MNLELLKREIGKAAIICIELPDGSSEVVYESQHVLTIRADSDDDVCEILCAVRGVKGQVNVTL